MPLPTLYPGLFPCIETGHRTEKTRRTEQPHRSGLQWQALLLSHNLMLLFFCKILARLPIGLLQALGWIAGWSAWLASPRHRRILSQNIQQAGFAPRTYCSIGQQGISALEMFAHWLRPIPGLLKHVHERRGWEHVEAALASGRPIIFVSPHLGALEMTGVCIAGWVPRTLAPLYRPPKQAFLEPLMIASRSRGGAHPAPANASGVRVLLKTLKQGGVAYLLPDQVPGAGEGVWAPFFGRPAFTMTLLSRLVLATNATVLNCWTERRGWWRGYRFHVEPLQGAFTGEPLADATLLNQQMQQLIAQAPEQYLWSYNRYKHPAGAPLPPEESV